MSLTTPIGYTCKCGDDHKYPGYVFAHWHEVLTHKCNCGTTHSIHRGIATLAKGKAK